jgi:hypothetical protein
VPRVDMVARARSGGWNSGPGLALKGAAVAAVYQRKNALAWLDPDEWADVRKLLVEELADPLAWLVILSSPRRANRWAGGATCRPILV